MKIIITYITVEFADVTTAMTEDFVILHYKVDWECPNVLTGSTLTGTLKTSQITDSTKVYAEIREFIKNVTDDRTGTLKTEKESRRSKN